MSAEAGPDFSPEVGWTKARNIGLSGARCLKATAILKCPTLSQVSHLGTVGQVGQMGHFLDTSISGKESVLFIFYDAGS